MQDHEDHEDHEEREEQESTGDQKSPAASSRAVDVAEQRDGDAPNPGADDAEAAASGEQESDAADAGVAVSVAAPVTGETDETETDDADADNTVTGDAESAEDETEEPAVEIHIPELKQILEGAILAADKPLSIDNMISLFAEGEQPSRKQVRAVLDEVEADFGDRGFELKQVASGYRFQVRERYGDWIGRLWEEKPPRYTRALLETLALIAYKQPITRGDVEDIRGVAVSTNIIRTLLEREWIRVVGHRDVPGKPAIYATTKTFLDYFNLSSLDELPTLSEIKDLEGANEELALDDEIIAPRSLDLTAGEGSDDSEAVDDGDDDADLDAVTDQVNSIQENIRNLFAQPEEEPDLADDDDGPEVEQAPDTGADSAAEETGVDTDTEDSSASPDHDDAGLENTDGVVEGDDEAPPVNDELEDEDEESPTRDA